MTTSHARSTCIAAVSRSTRMALLLALVVGPVVPVVFADTAHAQAPTALRDELLRHFDGSMNKFIALARAMPADRYTWSPGSGTMEVGQVFMHVAHYNYAYPTGQMGAPAPAGVDMSTMEAVRDKDEVVRALEASRAFVREFVGSRDGAALTARTSLYGRDIEQWAVLVQLVAHMNEHLGQAIAYARMNDVVPPWSR